MTHAFADSLTGNVDDELAAFSHDSLRMFMGEAAGHMGKWEYGSSLYTNDPAGGADIWAEMVRFPGDYYITQGDINLVQWAVNQESVMRRLEGIETLVELGPGSKDVVRQKTFSLINAAPHIRTFIALDISREFAEDTARAAMQDSGVHVKGIACDFTQPLRREWEGRTAFAILGSTISNMECHAGENPFHRLTGFLKNIRSGMREGDLIVLTFDSETDSNKVINAYSGKSAQRHGINLAYRLKRDGIITGSFDPRLWKYEPIWISKTSQCCHTIYPVVDQMARIQGFDIRIPAGRRYITNNSYKFSPHFVTWAAQTAGFNDCQVLSHESLCLLMVSF